MPESMFDKLGDILKETLDSGVIFQKNENPPPSQNEQNEHFEKSETPKKKAEDFSFDFSTIKTETKNRERGEAIKRGTQKSFEAKSFDFRAFSSSEYSSKTVKNAVFRPLSIPQNVLLALQKIGIPQNADFEEAKKIYREKLKQNHPDKFVGTQYERIAAENTRMLISQWEIVETWISGNS